MEIHEDLNENTIQLVKSATERAILCTNVKVLGVERAVPKGENFASVIYRISMQYVKDGSTVIKPFIIKTIPNNVNSQKFLKEVGLFPKELYVYSKVLPEIHKILQNMKKDSFETISADFFPTENNDVLVFEDLVSLGYTMIKRSNLLDYEHCACVLRTLAELHAASLALVKENPNFFDDCDETLCTEEKKHVLSMMCHLMKPMSESISSWEGYEHIGEKLKKISENITDSLIDVAKPNNNFLKVFCHGDSWKNNILFKHCEKTKKVQNVKFVDFQVSRYSSPTLDVLYFLYSSAQDEVLEIKYKIIQEYYKHLIDTLEQLGIFNIPFKLEDLIEDVKNRSIWAVFTTCVLRFGVLMEDEKAVDVDDIADKEKLDSLVGQIDKFLSEVCVNSLKKIFLQFENDGWLQ